MDQLPIVVESPKKSYTWILILIILLLAAGLSFFAYKYWQLKQQPAQVQPSPTPLAVVLPSSDPTAEWLTYTYKDIEFKYPSNWVVVTEKMTAVRPADLKSGVEYPAVTFQAIENPQNLSVKDYDNMLSGEGPDPVLYSSFIGNKEIIAEEKATKGVKGYYLKDQTCEPLGCDKFSFNYNGKIYIITNIFETAPPQPQPNKANLRQIFDLILSTFKFTEPSDWQTYSNTQYGFEIKYPVNFKALTDKDSLYGWPKAVVLFYSGGQSYDLPVEVWSSEAEYKQKYPNAGVTVFKKGSQFITLSNVNSNPLVDQIISTFKFTD